MTTFRGLSLLTIFFLASPAFAQADDNPSPEEKTNFEYKEVQSQSGLKYRVPEDLPIVVRNGIESPMPFDEYMYMKFKKIDDKLDRIEQTLERLEKAVTDASSGSMLKAS